MRAKAIGSVLLVILLLAACGSGTPSPTPPPSPSPCASPASEDDASQDPSGTGPWASSSTCEDGAGSGLGGPGPGAGGGGFDGSITRQWSETVTQSGDGFSSVVTQQYTAVVQVTLTKVDIGAWDITGQASITSSFTSDVTSRLVNVLGAECTTRHTDAASGSGTVSVTGGLEAGDGFYQFSVQLPGLDGSNDTVRDDSACGGPNNAETTLWSVAPISAGGSGDMTDATQVSGNSSVPREGGEDAITWSFTLPD